MRSLLDLDGVRHKHILCTAEGWGAPRGTPFAGVFDYASSNLGWVGWRRPFLQPGLRSGTSLCRRHFPNGASSTILESRKVYKWRYVAADFPSERLLTLTYLRKGLGGLHCFSKERQHRSQNCTIVIDLQTGDAWQQCYDNADCTRKVPVAQGEVRLREKRLLEHIPLDELPFSEQLAAFEREQNTSAAAAAEHLGGAGPDSGGAG